MARCTRNQHLHCVLHGLTLCSVTSRWHRSFAASIWNRQLRVCSKQFEVLQGDLEVTRFTCSECPESVFALCFARLDAPQGGLKVTRCTCHQCPESALAMYSTRPEALQGDLMVTQFICSRCLESAFSVRFQRFAAQGRWRAAACPHSTACCVSVEKCYGPPCIFAAFVIQLPLISLILAEGPGRRSGAEGPGKKATDPAPRQKGNNAPWQKVAEASGQRSSL